MVVAVTGGTGFVGNAVVAELVRQGHQVRVLVRDGSKSKLTTTERVAAISGDIDSPPALAELMYGADAVIHLVGIIREFTSKGITFEHLHTDATRNVVEAAKNAGVQRYLHMSANGATADGVTGYHRTKWAAEEIVRQSGLDWTIFRPSLIHGAGDQFVNMLARFVRMVPAVPVVPVIGDGEYLLQPVAVEDVAKGFANALNVAGSIGKAYHCGGPAIYSYNDLLDEIAAAMGRPSPIKVHQPISLMRLAAALLEQFPLFPVTNDQIVMLSQGNICGFKEWKEDLDIEPTPFAEGIKTYLA